MSNKNAALTPTIDQWIKAYSTSSEEAVLQLVNFVVESCGCDKKLTLEQYHEFAKQAEQEEEVHEQILQSLDAADVERDRGLYPIISKTRDGKRFRANFLDFWKKLVNQCQREILYDSYLLETLFLWLIGFSKYSIILTPTHFQVPCTCLPSHFYTRWTSNSKCHLVCYFAPEESTFCESKTVGSGEVEERQVEEQNCRLEKELRESQRAHWPHRRAGE